MGPPPFDGGNRYYRLIYVSESGKGKSFRKKWLQDESLDPVRMPPPWRFVGGPLREVQYNGFTPGPLATRRCIIPLLRSGGAMPERFPG